MTTQVPFIPENAPFTPEQRAWLNGLLSGIFSSVPVAQRASGKASLRVAILYASQSGTAEGLARKIAKELKAEGHQPSISTLVGYTPASLAQEQHALILASTYGDGDAPDGVQPFYEQLCLEHFPLLDKLQYSVLSLGDRHYENFCKFGRDLDAKLAALGANRICDRVDCDVEVNEPYSKWKEQVLTKLDHFARGRQPEPASAAKAAHSPAPLNAASSGAFSRDSPLMAQLIEKRILTHTDSSKSTLHLAFSIEGTGLSYQAGDACGVLPRNSPELVAEILQALRYHGNEEVVCGKGERMTLHDALKNHLQITQLSRKMIQKYATAGKCNKLLEMLKAENQQRLDSYIYGRGVIDLLIEFPGVIGDASELVGLLSRLTPRLYSISSSPLVHSGQVHTTVAVVRYKSHDRERGGVCSTLFADRVEVSDKLPIYIQPNKKFKLPKSSDAAMIMIGPGTGIAPFRGFLHERRQLGHSGKNWLFFGERSETTDFFYREELEGMLANGHLARLDTAFSRDQHHKLYVQDRMLEQAPLFWSWLQDGASVYVCGDASRMAKDVDVALRAIVQHQGAMSADDAVDYVANLKESHRYHRDVY